MWTDSRRMERGEPQSGVESPGHLYLYHDPIPDFLSPSISMQLNNQFTVVKNTHKEDLLSPLGGKWVSGSKGTVQT